MKTRMALFLSLFLVPVILSSRLPLLEQQAKLDPAMVGEVGRVLEGCRVAETPKVQREPPAQHWRVSYRDMVNVPVVVTASSVWSSVVVVDPNRQLFVVTNSGVVNNALGPEGRPSVFLLFFDLALKKEKFTAERFAKCITSDKNPGDWCQAVQHSSRLATVEPTDFTRDLALLRVTNMPSGVTGFGAADIKVLQPGDSVAVIGHTGKLLWRSTTGIMRDVQRFPDGDNGSETVIHMFAPGEGGISGGPLIGSNGRLAGWVVSEEGEVYRMDAVPMRTAPVEGVHYVAVGVDQVLRFLGGGHR